MANIFNINNFAEREIALATYPSAWKVVRLRQQLPHDLFRNDVIGYAGLDWLIFDIQDNRHIVVLRPDGGTR